MSLPRRWAPAFAVVAALGLEAESRAGSALIPCESVQGADAVTLELQRRLLSAFGIQEDWIGRDEPLLRVFYYPADPDFGKVVVTLWPRGEEQVALHVQWAKRSIRSANLRAGKVRSPPARVATANVIIGIDRVLAHELRSRVSLLLDLLEPAPPMTFYTHPSPMVFLDFLNRVEPRCGRFASLEEDETGVARQILEILEIAKSQPADRHRELVAGLMARRDEP